MRSFVPCKGDKDCKEQDDHEKLLERFYRTGGWSELSYVGFGIGFFIANEIIQRHDGLIEVKGEKIKD